MNEPLLQIDDLTVRLPTPSGPLTILDGVSLHVEPGETLGIVGESGSGKSMLAKSLMNLLPRGAEVDAREFSFRGAHLDPTDRASRRLWGSQISMVFQDPLTALNPVRTIGAQIADPLRLYRKMSKAAARREAIDLLGHVGIPSPAARVDQYPHELSGGMRQRAMIAIAVSCEPALLIADEPTTGLDVTVQGQILALLRRLKDEHSMAMILVSHDLALIEREVDRVAVMYAGEVVEQLPAGSLEHGAMHQYTRALLASHPDINAPVGTPVQWITGTPPDLRTVGGGCRFAPRCAAATAVCIEQTPPSIDVTPLHRHRCFHPATAGRESLVGDSLAPKEPTA